MSQFAFKNPRREVLVRHSNPSDRIVMPSFRIDSVLWRSCHLVRLDVPYTFIHRGLRAFHRIKNAIRICGAAIALPGRARQW